MTYVDFNDTKKALKFMMGEGREEGGGWRGGGGGDMGVIVKYELWLQILIYEWCLKILTSFATYTFSSVFERSG